MISEKCLQPRVGTVRGFCFPLYSDRDAGYTGTVHGFIHVYFSSAPPILLPIRVETTLLSVLETRASPAGVSQPFLDDGSRMVLC